MSGFLQSLSDDLVQATEVAGRSVVRVDDGTRLTASGVVWDSDVVVATSHGVERDDDLAVVTGDGVRQNATLVGRDPDTDVAVLRVEGEGLTPINRAAATEIKLGQLALALGRPGEGGLQVTLGVVGNLVPTVAGGGNGFLVQTDAVLYPGSSGGALTDVRGRFVALTNLWFGRGRGVGVGVSVIAETVAAILAHGRVPRGYLGVRTQPAAVSENLRQRLELTESAALLIVHIEQGSPAEQGGLLVGDSLLSIGGRPTTDGEEIRRALRGVAPGQEVPVRVLRGGGVVELSVSLGARH